MNQILFSTLEHCEGKNKMHYKRLLVLILFLASSLFFSTPAQNATISIGISSPDSSHSISNDYLISQNENRSRAQSLWEQAIAAKGGRERLYNVRSILRIDTFSGKPLRLRIDPEGRVSTKELKKRRALQEELLVLPDKVWIWDQQSSSYFGLNVFMYNYEKNLWFWGQGGASTYYFEPVPQTEGYTFLRETNTLISQLIFLMETKWVKPVPISVSTGEFAGRKVDVIETEVEARTGRLPNGKMRVDFSLDRETHLPVKVDFYRKHGGWDEAELQRSGLFKDQYGLAEYTEMSGVRIPIQVDDLTQRQQFAEGGNKLPPPRKEIVELNVDYDESIFTKPVQIERGPDVWRKKS